MRYILQACCVIAFVWPVLGIAQSGDPTGLYSVEGRNVDAKATYRGEVAISKDGEAFRNSLDCRQSTIPRNGHSPGR